MKSGFEPHDRRSPDSHELTAGFLSRIMFRTLSRVRALDASRRDRTTGQQPESSKRQRSIR